MRTKFIMILGGVFLVSGLYAGVGAQGKTVNDGIYSEDQAKRGGKNQFRVASAYAACNMSM